MPQDPVHIRTASAADTPVSGAAAGQDGADASVLADQLVRREEAARSNEAGGAPPSATSSAATVPDESGEEAITEDQVRLALRRVKDPELNLNIVDLGLVYNVAVDGRDVAIDMTLTSPGCPSGAEIMTNAEQEVRAVPGVADVKVNLVWSPYWTPEKIEPRVRAYLGF